MNFESSVRSKFGLEGRVKLGMTLSKDALGLLEEDKTSSTLSYSSLLCGKIGFASIGRDG